MDKVKKLYELLENSAGLFPENTAVCYLDSSISYSQLNTAANHIKGMKNFFNVIRSTI